MQNFLSNISPLSGTLIGTGFTYLVTLIGAATVFFFKDVNKKVMDLCLGFGAGVMLAASFWSLLSPAIELSIELNRSGWITPSIGFVTGGIFVMLSDIILSKITDKHFTESKKTSSFKRSVLLVLAVTIHNIPEGLSVGVAFGSITLGLENASVTSAMMIALGIGLQNLPEGACVALPLKREGYSRGKSFFYGQLSGMVEPLAGLLGVMLALSMRAMLPFLLSFSAGAMVSVVASELIPTSAMSDKQLCTSGVIFGFVVMMVLDVALGG